MVCKTTSKSKNNNNNNINNIETVVEVHVEHEQIIGEDIRFGRQCFDMQHAFYEIYVFCNGTQHDDCVRLAGDTDFFFRSSVSPSISQRLSLLLSLLLLLEVGNESHKSSTIVLDVMQVLEEFLEVINCKTTHQSINKKFN